MTRLRLLTNRRATMLTLTASACVVLAGCGSGSGGQLASPSTTAGSSARSAPSGGSATTSPMKNSPAALVAVTTTGALVRLNPSTGAQLSTLVPSDVVGDELAVAPDHASVYFEENKGCDHEVWKVAINGGNPVLIAANGSLPAINPAGDELAYAQEPLSFNPGCAPSGTDNGAGQWKLVIDDLSTHTVKSLPMAPDAISNGLPFSISHLSWSSNGSQLAVSIAAPEDNEGWAVNIVDPASATYYFGNSTPTVPIPAAQTAAGWFWHEAVFQPDGNLFVVKQCCAGLPETTTSVELDQVNPTTGATVHAVAVGLTDVGHTSLSVDRSGYWLLYLSGDNLEVSAGGAKPGVLASGLEAAAW
jgi:hypothetical protein